MITGRMRYFRIFSGKSLDEVAKKAGISNAKLSRAERGFAKLSLREKALIAQILGVSPEVLFEDSDDSRA